MTIDRKQPGDSLAFPAAAYNAFADTAEAFQEGRLDEANETAPAPQQQAGVVFVRNDSGAARERFEVLGLDAPIVTPADNLDEFKRQVTFVGVTPAAGTHDRHFAVLQEPVESGDIARAVVSGVTIARADLADVPLADAVMLAPADGGYRLQVRGRGSGTLLWKEADQADVWSVVQLSSAAYPLYAQIHGPGSSFGEYKAFLAPAGGTLNIPATLTWDSSDQAAPFDDLVETNRSTGLDAHVDTDNDGSLDRGRVVQVWPDGDRWYFTHADAGLPPDVVGDGTWTAGTDIDQDGDGNDDTRRISHVNNAAETQTVSADGLTVGLDANGHVHDFRGATPKKVGVSSNDAAPGYIGQKLTTGVGLAGTQQNDGGDEEYQLSLDIAAPGSNLALQNNGNTKEWVHTGPGPNATTMVPKALSGSPVYTNPTVDSAEAEFSQYKLTRDDNHHFKAAILQSGVAALSFVAGSALKVTGDTTGIKYEIDFESAPSDGDLFKWNATSGKFEPITTTQVTHVSDMRVDGASQKLQVKTQQIEVISADAESAWTDVHTGVSCP